MQAAQTSRSSSALEHTLAGVLLAGGLHLETGIVLEEVVTDRPIPQLPHQGEDTIGGDGGPTRDDLVEEDDDVPPAHVRGFALAPGRQHVASQVARVFAPALLLDFGVEVEVLRRQLGHRGGLTGRLALRRGIAPVGHTVAGVRGPLARVRQAHGRIRPERVAPQAAMGAVHDKPGLAPTRGHPQPQGRRGLIEVIHLPLGGSRHGGHPAGREMGMRHKPPFAR